MFKNLTYSKILIVVAALILIVGISALSMPARAESADLIKAGYGTATIDGHLGIAEWENAGVVVFSAITPEGSTPANLYIMNDETNLYLAVSIERSTSDSTIGVRYLFDNDNDNLGEHGDDFLVIYRNQYGTFFSDLFWSQIQNPPSLTFLDIKYGGTSDGSGAINHSNGLTVIEMSHALNSADDEHDYNLKGSNSVGLTLTLNISNSSGYASTRLPNYPQKFLDVEISGISVIVPNSLATSEGNYTNIYPFDLVWANKQSMRYQQVYDASEFSDNNNIFLITHIAFRPDGISGRPFSATIPDVQINLSTTSKTPDHLSTVFANNIGSNEKVVYSGPLSLSSENIGPYGGPKEFDIVVPLQSPFVYDPGVGNLLLDVRSSSSALTTVFDAHTEYGDPISNVFTVESDGVLQPSGVWYTGAPVTQFSMISVKDQIPLSDPNGPYIAMTRSQILFDGAGSSDPNGDPLTFAWDFGDGTTGTGVNPIKTYLQSGIFHVCLTVNNGILESEQVCTETIVHDPEGGFVTGGGWIWSGAGNYVPEPNVSGWASFGFVAKYHKGAEVPDGQAELIYHNSGMNFHSTQYDWLVVTGGNTAKFKGKGTINGDGEYKFMIWASDGAPDKFRIKIWEETNGEELVVYDNSLGIPAYENGQPIGKGSIVIHDQGEEEITYQCTDGWTANHTDTFATYILEVDRSTLGGYATWVKTLNRVDQSLSVFVTSLYTGNTWSFTEPHCGESCSYLIGWYGGTGEPVGEGAGLYRIEISQDKKGEVGLRCVD